MISDKPAYQGMKAQTVIIGGGGAGLAAAVAAAEKGAKVILLEKRLKPGGDTALAGGFFASESPALKRLRSESSSDELFKAAIGYAHWKTNPRILRAFINKSGDTVQWLEGMGVKFEDISQFIPLQGPRIMHLPMGLGAGLVRVLVKKCQSLGVKILYRTAAEKILIDKSGKVTGVTARSKGEAFTISAKSVIIGSGGYAGNRELLKKYYPFYTETLHCIGLPHKGDGLLMAMEIGAATEGLGTLLLRGPIFPGSMDITHVAMEPTTIWVNKRGERFVDEAIGYNWPESANALNRQPERTSYTLLDERIKQYFIEEGLIKGYRHPPLTKMTGLQKRLQAEADKGTVKISNSWGDVARWIGAAPRVLKETIKEYNASCDRGYDMPFLKDRRYLFPLRTPPYYVLKCYQGFLGTIGGIKINHHMEVLNQQDDPIHGLYAAGSITGGWESDTYCLRLSGSAFGFALNSGRIAGENAVKYGSGKQ
jgi:fumarate reductase flavoprotein subunit